MKKLLGILVLGLLFISIDLSNPTRVEALKDLSELDKRGFFEKQWDNLNYKLDDLNPVNYFEKRKECKEEADRADTVYEGKERYKDCMDD